MSGRAPATWSTSTSSNTRGSGGPVTPSPAIAARRSSPASGRWATTTSTPWSTTTAGWPKREWAKRVRYKHSSARNRAPPHRISYNNERRPHSALDRQPPSTALTTSPGRTTSGMRGGSERPPSRRPDASSSSSTEVSARRSGSRKPAQFGCKPAALAGHVRGRRRCLKSKGRHPRLPALPISEGVRQDVHPRNRP